MLIVLENLGSKTIGNKGQTRGYSLVKCSCGCEFELQTYRINNITFSCKSCSSLKHGFNKKGGRNRIYSIWDKMKTRCFNSNSKSFDRYGGRGITVCDEWKDNFITFKDWALQNGYEDNLSIDRINNDGNYEPSNCRWTTQKVQARNTTLYRKTNTSGKRGVFKVKDKYISKITVDNKSFHLGTFDDIESATLAYNNYITENNLEHTRNKI